MTPFIHKNKVSIIKINIKMKIMREKPVVNLKGNSKFLRYREVKEGTHPTSKVS